LRRERPENLLLDKHNLSPDRRAEEQRRWNCEDVPGQTRPLHTLFGGKDLGNADEHEEVQVPVISIAPGAQAHPAASMRTFSQSA
jgi:hypothetical protein